MSRSPKAARLADTSRCRERPPGADDCAGLAQRTLELDQALHLGQEPGGDAGHLLELSRGQTPSEERQEPPEPGVGGGQEALQDQRSRGPDGVGGVGADEPVIAHEDLAQELLSRCAATPLPEARERPGQVVERRAPGRILGQEAGARLLQAAQRLVERRAEGPVDGHDLAGRLHLRAELAVGGRELVEREARQLDDDIVERRLEGGHGRAGDGVGDLLQPSADGDLGGHPGDRVAGRLRGQGGRAADPRVDLDDGVVSGVGRERELDVAAALDAERPDDRQGGAAQPLVDLVRAASGPGPRRSNRRCGRRAGRRSPSSRPRCTCRPRRA